MAQLRPSYQLNIGQQTITDESPLAGLSRLLIERHMDTAADGARLWLMERIGIAVGDELAIELGHDGENERAFTGDIIQVRPKLNGIEVMAVGKMNALLNTYTSDTYEGKSAGDIANDLISAASIDAGTVESGLAFPRYAIDAQLSAYAHLRRLAFKLGFEVYGDRDGKINFHGLGAGAGLEAGGLGGLADAASSILGGGGVGFAYGQHAIQANAAQRTLSWEGVDVGGESPSSGQGDKKAHWLTVEDSSYRGSAGSGDKRLINDPSARTKDMASRLASGYLVTLQRGANTATIRILGNAAYDLGDDISLSEMPDSLLDGSGYLRGITHRLDAQHGFISDFTIERSNA